jgi:hypothetical protein
MGAVQQQVKLRTARYDELRRLGGVYNLGEASDTAHDEYPDYPEAE